MVTLAPLIAVILQLVVLIHYSIVLMVMNVLLILVIPSKAAVQFLGIVTITISVLMIPAALKLDYVLLLLRIVTIIILVLLIHVVPKLENVFIRL